MGPDSLRIARFPTWVQLIWIFLFSTPLLLFDVVNHADHFSPVLRILIIVLEIHKLNMQQDQTAKIRMLNFDIADVYFPCYVLQINYDVFPLRNKNFRQKAYEPPEQGK